VTRGIISQGRLSELGIAEAGTPTRFSGSIGIPDLGLGIKGMSALGLAWDLIFSYNGHEHSNSHIDTAIAITLFVLVIRPG